MNRPAGAQGQPPAAPQPRAAAQAPGPDGALLPLLLHWNRCPAALPAPRRLREHRRVSSGTPPIVAGCAAPTAAPPTVTLQVGSFRRGLKTLPEAIAAKLGDAVHCNWTLKGIEKEGSIYKCVWGAGCCTRIGIRGARGIGDGWRRASTPGCGCCACCHLRLLTGWSPSPAHPLLHRLSYDTPAGPKVVRTRTVALTAPAYVVADLVADKAPAAAEALKVGRTASTRVSGSALMLCLLVALTWWRPRGSSSAPRLCARMLICTCTVCVFAIDYNAVHGPHHFTLEQPLLLAAPHACHELTLRPCACGRALIPAGGRHQPRLVTAQPRCATSPILLYCNADPGLPARGRHHPGVP